MRNAMPNTCIKFQIANNNPDNQFRKFIPSGNFVIFQKSGKLPKYPSDALKIFGFLGLFQADLQGTLYQIS